MYVLLHFFFQKRKKIRHRKCEEDAAFDKQCIIPILTWQLLAFSSLYLYRRIIIKQSLDLPNMANICNTNTDADAFNLMIRWRIATCILNSHT